MLNSSCGTTPRDGSDIAGGGAEVGGVSGVDCRRLGCAVRAESATAWSSRGVSSQPHSHSVCGRLAVGEEKRQCVGTVALGDTA
jgi:hypothetical protein